MSIAELGLFSIGSCIEYLEDNYQSMTPDVFSEIIDHMKDIASYDRSERYQLESDYQDLDEENTSLKDELHDANIEIAELKDTIWKLEDCIIKLNNKEISELKARSEFVAEELKNLKKDMVDKGAY